MQTVNKTKKILSILLIVFVVLICIRSFYQAASVIYYYFDNAGSQSVSGLITDASCEENRHRGDVFNLTLSNSAGNGIFSVAGFFTCEKLDISGDYINKRAVILVDSRGVVSGLSLEDKEIYSKKEMLWVRLISSLVVGFFLLITTLILFKKYKEQQGLGETPVT